MDPVSGLWVSWELLEALRTRGDGPWLVAGVFNEDLTNSEVSSWRVRERSRMNAFKECIMHCGLGDLGFEGYKYTFLNKRKYPHECKASLDRSFGDVEWQGLFPQAYVCHGEYGRSDHCSLVIGVEGGERREWVKQFRYEAMWQRKTNFNQVLEEMWGDCGDDQTNLADKLGMCAEKLKTWNKEVFGNVDRKALKCRREQERLRRVQRTEEVMEREERLFRELDELMASEETLWRQRSRVQWREIETPPSFTPRHRKG